LSRERSEESGLEPAVGLPIAGLHLAGLATVTHTPAPMGFLSRILERPRNEKPYLLLPVGYPAPGCRVPDLARKPLAEVLNRRRPAQSLQ
jgi:iodotyrosine deiodinase